MISVCDLTFQIHSKSDIIFADASHDQTELLTQLALDSNAIYQYRIVSDQQARNVFQVTQTHLSKGLIRVMQIPSAIIGFFGLLYQENKGNTLSHLFLNPEFIGKGYGKKLFAEALRAARQELNWNYLLWDSDPNAAWFYHKMGARQIGENPCPLNPKFKTPLFIYTLT